MKENYFQNEHSKAFYDSRYMWVRLHKNALRCVAVEEQYKTYQQKRLKLPRTIVSKKKSCKSWGWDRCYQVSLSSLSSCTLESFDVFPASRVHRGTKEQSLL